MVDTTNVWERWLDQIILVDNFTEFQQPAPDQNWAGDYIYANDAYPDAFNQGPSISPDGMRNGTRLFRFLLLSR